MHLILSASVNISVINTIFKQILIFSPKNGRFLRKNTYSAISQIVKGYKLEILFVGRVWEYLGTCFFIENEVLPAIANFRYKGRR